MGPVSTTITGALHEIQAALNTTDFSEGQDNVLGTRVDFSPSSSDDILAYIATATPPAGFAEGDVFSGPGYANRVALQAQVSAGLIETYSKPADSGGQSWIYIEAGVAIARGEALMIDATLGGKFEAILADEAGKVIGVAQWNIPDNSFAWVLCSGVGKVLVGTAGVTVGERLEITPAGSAEDVTAASDVGYGRALETAVSGGLADACISCPV